MRDLRSIPSRHGANPHVCDIAAAIISAAVVGSTATVYASGKASKAQVGAAKAAQQTQLEMYNRTRNDLLPYSQGGVGAFNKVNALLGVGGGAGGSAAGPDWNAYLAGNADVAAAAQQNPNGYGDVNGDGQITPIDFAMGHYQAFGKNENRALPQTAGSQGGNGGIMAELQQLPGYQFALTQGLKSVQNSAAARGLGASGPAMKGAATYATGLADQTYGNQINRLMAAAGLGENAAAQTGNAGGQAAQGISSAQIGAGNAQAAGWAGIANGVNQLGSGLTNAAFYNQYFGSGGAGNAGGVGGWGAYGTNLAADGNYYTGDYGGTGIPH